MALIAATRAEGGLVFFSACTLVIILVRHSEGWPDIARYIQNSQRQDLGLKCSAWKTL